MELIVVIGVCLALLALILMINGGGDSKKQQLRRGLLTVEWLEWRTIDPTNKWERHATFEVQALEYSADGKMVRLRYGKCWGGDADARRKARSNYAAPWQPVDRVRWLDEQPITGDINK